MIDLQSKRFHYKNKKESFMKKENDTKVGLFGLTALIVGSSIGSGIFALPAGANAEGILIGWLIVGIGMFSLVSVYRNLTLRQPKIDDGIYGWSKHSFGGFIGAYEMKQEMSLECFLSSCNLQCSWSFWGI